MKIGALEAGGTKMVCAIGDEAGNVVKRLVIPTGTPGQTMPAMLRFYEEEGIDSLGIACFGPLDLNVNSPTYGHITSTPKQDWANYDIVGKFKKTLHCPVGFDTDVNGAVLGEVCFGAAKGCDTAIYITIGTGVGVGVYVNGGLLHGLIHPEAGHILLTRQAGDEYKGHCPYHANCLEGLASGPALAQRFGRPAAELADCREVWELESDYIAQAVANYVLMFSPQKVILGGGVMHQIRLLPMIRGKVRKLLNGYLVHDLLEEKIDRYIVAPGLGDDAGIKGALMLGMQAARGQ